MLFCQSGRRGASFLGNRAAHHGADEADRPQEYWPAQEAHGTGRPAPQGVAAHVPLPEARNGRQPGLGEEAAQARRRRAQVRAQPFAQLCLRMHADIYTRIAAITFVLV